MVKPFCRTPSHISPNPQNLEHHKMNPGVSYGLRGIEADQFKLIFGHTWTKLARQLIIGCVCRRRKYWRHMGFLCTAGSSVL